jgi:hypothetical protein
MVRKVDLALKLEHAVFEDADARDESGLVAFELGYALAVGLREAVESFEQFRLGVAECFLKVIELVVHLGSQDSHVLP